MPYLRIWTLKRAAVILGGELNLAVELGLQPGVLARYLGGESPVPQSVFLKATEIVTAASISDATKRKADCRAKKYRMAARAA